MIIDGPAGDGGKIDVRICKHIRCGKRFVVAKRRGQAKKAFCSFECQHRWFNSKLNPRYRPTKQSEAAKEAAKARRATGIKRGGHKAPASYWTAKALSQLRSDYAGNAEALAWIEANASAIGPEMCNRIDKPLFTAIPLSVIERDEATDAETLRQRR